MTTKKNFKFDEEKSYLRGTEKNGKFYATFNAIADDGTVELREFVWKSEGDKVLVKDEKYIETVDPDLKYNRVRTLSAAVVPSVCFTIPATKAGVGVPPDAVLKVPERVPLPETMV